MKKNDQYLDTTIKTEILIKKYNINSFYDNNNSGSSRSAYTILNHPRRPQRPSLALRHPSFRIPSLFHSRISSVVSFLLRFYCSAHVSGVYCNFSKRATTVINCGKLQTRAGYCCAFITRRIASVLVYSPCVCGWRFRKKKRGKI